MPKVEHTIDVKFDVIITAEQARAYKPAPEGSQLVKSRLGLKVSQIWHAGFGFKYDIVPAKKLGYTTFWVNRQAQARPGRVKETFLVRDMRTLVCLVKGVAASECDFSPLMYQKYTHRCNNQDECGYCEYEAVAQRRLSVCCGNINDEAADQRSEDIRQNT